MSENLIKALVVTAEVCGTDFSDAAAKAIVMKLAAYPEKAVLAALDRCQLEVTGRLSLAAIVQRLDDGRPGTDEAWSNAIRAKEEDATVVRTSETAKAYWAAVELLANGDKVGARMAFRDAYEREVAESRRLGKPVNWEVSLGHDPRDRETAIRQAAELNKIGVEYARVLLPSPQAFGTFVIEVADKLLESHTVRITERGKE